MKRWGELSEQQTPTIKVKSSRPKGADIHSEHPGIHSEHTDQTLYPTDNPGHTGLWYPI